MEAIKFKSGQFREFTATRSFALGDLDVRIAKGTELLFDGSKVNYAGDEYVFPQLRSAVVQGWIVLTDEYDEGNPAYNQRISANIKVRPAVENGGQEAKTISAVSEPDERVVMNTKEHAQTTREQNKNARQQVIRKDSNDQDGIPVRTLKTPTQSKTELTGENAARSIRAAENVQITAGAGISVQDMMARMSDEQREEYLAKKAAVRVHVPEDEHKSGKVVAKIKKSASKSTTEGIAAVVQTGGGTETVDLSGTGGAPKASVIEEDGIRFSNTNGPKNGHHIRRADAVSVTNEMSSDERRSIALSMCPEFPETYDFAAPMKKKLARLQADFDDRVDVLMATFAAESEPMKQALAAEFPIIFRG